VSAAIVRDGDALLLAVKGRPGAKVDRIRGVSADHVLVDVAAVAQDGRATERLLGFLATSFGVSRRDVELISGAHARWKRVRVRGAARIPEELRHLLES
jgi:uncharacterized protein (TIGR00251 family)